MVTIQLVSALKRSRVAVPLDSYPLCYAMFTDRGNRFQALDYTSGPVFCLKK